MPASQSLNLLLTCNILTGLHNKENCYKAEKHNMIKTKIRTGQSGARMREYGRVTETGIITKKERGYEGNIIKEV